MKKVISIVLCVFMLAQLTGCGSGEKECKAVLDEFESACNEKDIEAMLECIDPDISSKIQAAVSLVGTFADVDTDTALKEVEEILLGAAGDIGVEANELFETLEFEMTKYEEKGKNASVYVDMSFETAGVPMTKHGIFTMKKVDGTWYIQNFQFTSESEE